MQDFNELPKTRKDAKVLKEQFYFTSKECKNGHTSKRYTNSGACWECRADYSRKNKDKVYKWREKNRSKYNKYQKNLMRDSNSNT